MKINTWHLRHPWQQPPSKNGQLSLQPLSAQQKRISLIALVIGLPFALIGGVIAFYAVCHYFKQRQVEKLSALAPPAQKVQDQANQHLSSPKPISPPNPPIAPAPSQPSPPTTEPPPPASLPKTLTSPSAHDLQPPAQAPRLFATTALGEMKAFQGDNNSCGICSVLYSLFATTSAFDFLLEGDSHPVRDSLRIVVQKFRTEGYVPSTDVEVLRQQICPYTGEIGRKIDLDEFFDALLRKLGISSHEYVVDPTAVVFTFNGIQQASTSTQALISGNETCLREDRAPLPKIGQAITLYIPRERGMRPFKQVIPQPEIEVQSSQGPVKMKLASVITMGDYDPAEKLFGEAHFVSFSFDEQGNGYAYDSMANRVIVGGPNRALTEAELGDESFMNQLRFTNSPKVRRLEGLLPKLQELEPDDRIGRNPDVRRILFNLRACIYIRK